MYAINLDETGRVLSATYPQYAPKDAVLVDVLPDGDISDYIYRDGEFIIDPIPKEEEAEEQPEEDNLLEMMLDHEYRICMMELNGGLPE